MNLPAKLAAAIGILGGGSVAGCYFGGVFNDTPWFSLKEEVGSQDTYNGKIGKSHGIYLLAVHGVGNDDNKDLNKAKWEELYKSWLNNKDLEGNDALSTEFGEGKVKDAYSDKDSAAQTSDPKTLNKVCQDIYGKAETDFSFDTSDSHENKHRLARDLFKYCSPLGKKPVTLKALKGSEIHDYGTGNIGSDDTNKDSLIDPYHKDNYYFWVAQEKWFLSETFPKTDNYFKNFFTEGENSRLKKSLKDICYEAYGKTGEDTSSEQQPKKDDVKKYCAFHKIT